MIPWIIIAVIVFSVTRRNAAPKNASASDDETARARTEQEFAEAEAYEAKWHEEDKGRYHKERLP